MRLRCLLPTQTAVFSAPLGRLCFLSSLNPKSFESPGGREPNAEQKVLQSRAAPEALGWRVAARERAGGGEGARPPSPAAGDLMNGSCAEPGRSRAPAPDSNFSSRRRGRLRRCCCDRRAFVFCTYISRGPLKREGTRGTSSLGSEGLQKAQPLLKLPKM